MKSTVGSLELTPFRSLFLWGLLLSAAPQGTTAAQPALPIEDAPSTVGAVMVEPSPARELRACEKLNRLYVRNTTQEYVLQRLTRRSYWFQSQHYSTIFYVGDAGVLLFDPLENQREYLEKAIAKVTHLPITTLVYSHDHADHIGDAEGFVDTATSAGVKLRVIASSETADKMTFLKSALPKPTETLPWPRARFQFEGLNVEMHGFERAAHSDDHSIWLLEGEKVAHVPDLINPDQPPFWAFAGSENAAYYKANVEQLARLDWSYLSAGHGNIGCRADIAFYREFLSDLDRAVGKAMGAVPWGTGVDATALNSHTAFLPTWLEAVARQATEELRPKYGRFYGFEHATPRNAAMVAQAMFSYK